MKASIPNHALFVVIFGIVISTIFSHNPVKADIAGSDMQFVCAGNGDYEVTFRLIRKCDGNPLSDTLALDASPEGSCSDFTFDVYRQNVEDISNLCESQCSACDNGCSFDHGYELHTYQGMLNTSQVGSSCCNIKVSLDKCCRPPEIDNIHDDIGGNNFYTEGTINQCVTPCQSSPEYDTPPLTLECEGDDISSVQAGSAGSSDSVHHSLVNPLQSENNSVNWESGHNKNEPIEYMGFNGMQFGPNSPFPRGFHFNVNSGLLQFRFETLMNGVMATETEQYVGDTLASKVRRDMLVQAIDCPSSILIHNGPYATIDICVDSTYNAEVEIFNSDSLSESDSIFIQQSFDLKNAVFQPDSGLNSVKGLFEFTPDTSQAGESLEFYYEYFKKRCPITVKKKTKRDLLLNVFANPELNVNVNQKSCGKTEFIGNIPNIDDDVTMSWHFDGESDTLSGDTVSNTFDEPGLYPYSVTLTDIECERTFYDTVEIQPLLEIDINQKDTMLCEEETLWLKPEVQHYEDSVQLYINNVAFSDSVELSPVNDTTIVVEAVDGGGCTSQESFNIDMRIVPESPVSDQNYCKDESFSSISAGNVSSFDVFWTDSLDDTVNTGGFFTPSSTGTYTNTIVDQLLPRCQTSNEFDVKRAGEAEHSLDDTVICKGSTLEKSPIIEGATYQWYHIDASETIGSDSTLSYQATEEGRISLTVEKPFGNTMCTYHDTFEVTFDARPQETLELSGQFCRNNPSVTLPESDNYATTWDGPGVEDFEFDPESAGSGTHNLEYTLIHPNTGCPNTQSVEVTVVTEPVEQLAGPGDQCLNAEKQPLEHSGSFPTDWSGAGIEDEYWNPSEAGEGEHELSYTLTDNNTGCTSTNTHEVEVFGLPELDFTADPEEGEQPLTVNFEGLPGSDVIDPVWFIDDQDTISGSWSVSHTYDSTGTYTIGLAGTGETTGCQDTLIRENHITVSPMNMIMTEEAKHIKIYPNPASESLEISIEGDIIEKLVLTTTSGREVKTFHPESRDAIISGKDIASGSYILMIHLSSGEVQQAKVVFR